MDVVNQGPSVVVGKIGGRSTDYARLSSWRKATRKYKGKISKINSRKNGQTFVYKLKRS